MQLNELQRHWNLFGHTDPLWAILTEPGKDRKRWDLEEFFQTGVEEIREVMEYARAVAPGFGAESVLDFGCGVGRLTQALSKYFTTACGIDIAPSMIEAAGRLNAAGERCRYVLNTSENICLPDSTFDFIYTSRVLQHIEPAYSRQYLREFVRLLKPRGVLIFQLPDRHNYALDLTPLPDSCYSAEIEAPAGDIRVEASSRFTLAVTVRNAGQVTWPVFTQGQVLLRLGNHWLDAAGEAVQWDDSRCDLTAAVEPGASAVLNITLTAPTVPGEYLLEFDMIHEHLCWFSEKGSPACRIPAVVVNSVSAAPPQDLIMPTMEMYGVPQDVVIDTVASAGGFIIDIVADDAPGIYWTSYRYCVRKF